MGCLCSCLKQQDDNDGNASEANEFTPLTTGNNFFIYFVISFLIIIIIIYYQVVVMKAVVEKVAVIRNVVIMIMDLKEGQVIINL